MALLVSDQGNVPAPVVGLVVEQGFLFTTDTDYPTGGYPLTAATLGFTTLEQIFVGPTSGYVPEYDYAANKLKIMYGDNNNAADGPLIEVPAGLDAITGLVFRGFARGAKV